MKRLAGAILVGLASGVGAAFVYVIPYAIVSLYLSGHSMTPAWFDAAAEALLFVVAGGVAVGAGAVNWRASRPR
jgi:hypothetical protein